MILSTNKTLMEDITAAREVGYTTEFLYRDEKIHCQGTGKSYNHDECILVRYYRQEGMNDPGDASILFLIACRDGSKGFLSSAYGVYADTDLIDFIHSLKKRKPS